MSEIYELALTVRFQRYKDVTSLDQSLLSMKSDFPNI